MAELVLSSLDLGPRGKRLFKAMQAQVTDPVQMELLVEACRIVDQLEDMHKMMNGDKESWRWIKMPRNGGNLILEIDNLVTQRRSLQLALKQITTALSVAGEVSDPLEDKADELARRREARRAAQS